MYPRPVADGRRITPARAGKTSGSTTAARRARDPARAGRNLNDHEAVVVVEGWIGVKVRPSRSSAQSTSTRRRARASRAWVWSSRSLRLRS